MYRNITFGIMSKATKTKTEKTKSEEYEKASFNLKPGLLKKFKKMTLEKDVSMTQAINSMIEYYLKTKGEYPPKEA